MAAITGILCQIITAAIDHAKTDGDVYLGVAGREFLLDSEANDFEWGAVDKFFLGRGGSFPFEYGSNPVKNAPLNDPVVGFPLDTAALDHTPTYIRFAPEDDDDTWDIRHAVVLVYVAETDSHPTFSNRVDAAFRVPSTFHDLWLGKGFGEVLHLTERLANGFKRALDDGARLGRERAPG